MMKVPITHHISSAYNHHNSPDSTAVVDSFQLFMKSDSMQVAASVKSDMDSMRVLRSVCTTQKVMDEGFVGTSVPYSPDADDFIALILLCCFLLVSAALCRGRNFIKEQLSSIFFRRAKDSFNVSLTFIDIRFNLLLTLHTCIMFGLIYYLFLYGTRPAFIDKISHPLLLGIYVGFFVVYFIVKRMVYAFLGRIFFDSNVEIIWRENYSALINYIGFLFLPLLICDVYCRLDVSILVTIVLFLVFLVKFSLFYKGIMLFLHQFHDLFLIILYFCALEIIPLFLLYKGLVIVNNILQIKF
ncbi:MAG: DUF4271 domain-containing protein [Bacteroidaceae bacterium]